MKKMNQFWRYYIKFKMILIPDGPLGDRKRGRLYAPFLNKYGANFKIGTNAFIYNPNGLIVGNHVYIGFNSYIGQGRVTLHDEVLIGNFVSITASNHLRNNGSFRFGGFESKPIEIGKGTWIGANSCIVAGVRIGNGCLVAAGSVVTDSCLENNKVIAGVPAKIIKNIN